jgi:hypothetical protein
MAMLTNPMSIFLNFSNLYFAVTGAFALGLGNFRPEMVMA